MAQRTIHYLFGDILSKENVLKDKNRFLLGSVLPDAYSSVVERDISHFTDTKLPNNQVYFDFMKFRAQFNELIKTDDLYLGYYMHLVEDDFYRQFIREIHMKNDVPHSAEEVARLHNDYHILNAYIVEKYKIEYTLVQPVDFKMEPVNRIVRFTLERFLEDLQHDFTENPQGKTCFLTEDMLDQFIDQYIDLAIKELHSVLNGEYYLNAIDYAWTRPGNLSS